jgi:RNA polymerase-binding protein DksA
VNEAYRARLVEMRARLLDRVSRMSRSIRHTDRPQSSDSQERAIDDEHNEVLDALDDAGRRELNDIDAALKRLEAGTFGYCERCGAPISKARLEALPFVSLCLECAR